MPHYKLTYFNLRGRAEVSRYLFALADQEYEDVRIERADWPKIKDSSPFGQMPWLEVDGKIICQSHTIERYLAKQFGYAGTGNWDQARADMIVACMEDCVGPLAEIRKMENLEEKAKLADLFFVKVHNSFEKFEGFLKENNGGDGYIVGDSLTYADLVLEVYPQAISHFTGGRDVEWSRYPKLSALRERVKMHPKIAAWAAKRPKTDM